MTHHPHQLGQGLLELRLVRLAAVQRHQQILDLAVLTAGVLVLLRHPKLGPQRVQHDLLGEGVQRQLETDLVDQHPAVATAGLQMLELPLHDRVVVDDQVVDVAGQGGVAQAHAAPQQHKKEDARPYAFLGRLPQRCATMRARTGPGGSRTVAGVPKPPETSDRRRLRGQQTRALILAQAVDLASAEGLGSVSLARLGADLQISKSGVSGHFASREDLQLAVIDVAARLYAERVAAPALAAPPGLPQLWMLCERWIEFMRSGELRGRRQAAGPARPVLRRALALAQSCGAHRLARRARTELWAIGARPHPLGQVGLSRLTPSERRIGERAGAQGNREIARELFVTLKTVETHLSSAYRKLGIRRRAELGPLLANETGQVPTV